MRRGDGRWLALGVVGLLAGGSLLALGQARQEPLPALLCEDYTGLPPARQGEARQGMIRLDGGGFTLGSDRWYPEERPARRASVDGFWIDRHPVTNAQFAAFVAATGYLTRAERGLPAEALEGLPPAAARPGSLVFGRAPADPGWRFVPGAHWRQPEGPGSDIGERMHHPVVHITYEDAKAYAEWAGRALPTEAQLEYAARGGLEDADFAWGAPPPEVAAVANTWQGAFPLRDLGTDGYRGTSPVGCYPGNGYGLFDMGGNVWELTRTWYRPGHEPEPGHNPQGPDSSLDPRDPGMPVKVIKGGSHLCSPDYCLRYRPSARQPQLLYLGSSHIGFRTVSGTPPG